MSFHVVLFQPEIPQNTGNIGRICVGYQTTLHLIEPLGFQIDDTKVKRAGLDYWPHLIYKRYPSWSHWLQTVSDQNRMFLFSTKTNRAFYDVQFQEGDILVFGRETKGLTPEIYEAHCDRLVTIPFPGKIRSFNVANAVSMGLSEAYRQVNHKLKES